VTIMKSARLGPRLFEGGSFTLRDLCVALSWAKGNPTMRLHIMLDHPDISEVIEVCPPLSANPRWLIWNTLDGELRVIDLVNANFALPYLTVDSTLRFIRSAS
jgi:hypothetical protein